MLRMLPPQMPASRTASTGSPVARSYPAQLGDSPLPPATPTPLRKSDCPLVPRHAEPTGAQEGLPLQPSDRKSLNTECQHWPPSVPGSQ